MFVTWAKKQFMLTKLQKEFEIVEEKKRQLFSTINSAGQDIYIKPSNEKWTISMVAEHLYFSESGILYNIKKYLSKNKGKSKGLYHDIRSLILRIALKSPMKFKAPPIDLLTPKGEMQLQEIDDNWNNLREEFKKHLEDYTQKNVNILIFKHPAAGMMTIVQTLQFMGQHIDHHLHQVKRIKKELEAGSLKK
jgi:uncharacterized damage-inducible protein DinB